MEKIVENGTKIPSLRVGLAIAEVLETTVDKLCKGV